MSVLRIASLAVTALWIGGLSALVTVAAPSLFSVLGKEDPASGRALANLVIGDMFSRFQYVSWVLGGSLIGLLVLRALLGPRPRRLAIQVALVATMLATSAFVLSTSLIALTLVAGLALFWIETKD